jgi:hypothetical protein
MGDAVRVGYTIDQYTADIFMPYLERAFAFLCPGEDGQPAETVELELVEVTRHGSGPSRRVPPGCRQEPFSLLFRARSQRPLGKGLHKIQHPDFEACDLFLERVSVPGRETSGVEAYYEAAFA